LEEDYFKEADDLESDGSESTDDDEEKNEKDEKDV